MAIVRPITFEGSVGSAGMHSGDELGWPLRPRSDRAQHDTAFISRGALGSCEFHQPLPVRPTIDERSRLRTKLNLTPWLFLDPPLDVRLLTQYSIISRQLLVVHGGAK